MDESTRTGYQHQPSHDSFTVNNYTGITYGQNHVDDYCNIKESPMSSHSTRNDKLPQYLLDNNKFNTTTHHAAVDATYQLPYLSYPKKEARFSNLIIDNNKKSKFYQNIDMINNQYEKTMSTKPNTYEKNSRMPPASPAESFLQKRQSQNMQRIAYVRQQNKTQVSNKFNKLNQK